MGDCFYGLRWWYVGNNLHSRKGVVIMQNQGKLWDKYQIYLACTNDSPPKSFDDWLNS